MKFEIYKHYATGEERRLQIVSEVEKFKVGFEKGIEKPVKISRDLLNRWRIKGTSFIQKDSKEEADLIKEHMINQEKSK